jgi:hypothetical protein
VVQWPGWVRAEILDGQRGRRALEDYGNFGSLDSELWREINEGMTWDEVDG